MLITVNVLDLVVEEGCNFYYTFISIVFFFFLIKLFFLLVGFTFCEYFMVGENVRIFWNYKLFFFPTYSFAHEIYLEERIKNHPKSLKDLLVLFWIWGEAGFLDMS